MNISPKIHTAKFIFKCDPTLLKTFKEVVGKRNVSKVLRNFMKETVEKTKKSEGKTV
jgi:hypothetical protein